MLLGELENAQQVIETTQTLFQQINLNSALLKNQINFTTANIAQLYQQISQQAHQLKNHRLESSTLGYLGELAYQHKLNSNISPQNLLEQALNIAQTYQTPEIAYRWQWQLGKLYSDRGEISKAQAAYESAFVTLQNLRSDLVALDREIQFSFRQQVEPVYREYTKLSLYCFYDGAFL